MDNYWNQFEKFDVNNKDKAEFWDQFEKYSDEKMEAKPETFEEKIIKQPAAAVKGLAKGLANLPSNIGKLLPLLVRQLTPEEAPFRQWIEEKTQKALQAESPLGKAVAAHLEKKLPSSEETRIAEEFGGRFAPYIADPLIGLLMAGAGQTLQESGVGPVGQAVGEIGTGLLSNILAKGTTSLKQALEAKPLLTEEGLQLPKAAYAKPSRLIKPIAREGSKEAILENLGKQIDEIIKPMKGKAIPTSATMTAEQLEGKATSVLKHVDQMANRLTGEVLPSKATNVKNYLSQQKQILKRAKVPAEETRKVLTKINRFESMYSPLTEHTPADMLNQFREINADLTTIYENYHILGKQKKMKQFLEGLNRSFVKDIERDFAKERTFVSRFKQGNELWKQHKKLQEFAAFMDVISPEGKIDPFKFRKEVMTKGGKNKIIKALGKEEYEKLSNIASDIKKAEIGLKDIKPFDLTKRMVSNYVLNAIFKLVGLDKIFKGVLAPKYALSLAKGYLLTRPAVYRNTRLLLNAVKNNNIKAIPVILEKLNKETEKEIK